MRFGLILPTLLLLVACEENLEPVMASGPAAARAAYTVMDHDLQELKDAFNANRGRVRLVFLNGPTCGICLRGMADLNDAFLGASQGEQRLVTFVVHVPTMGAEEEHAAESIPLLDGPRVHHFWEETGIIGQHYGETMGTSYYVWDFWAIYRPDAVWEGMIPPVPDYYEHQLGVTSGGSRVFSGERVLDADRFAEKTLAMVAEIDAGQLAQATQAGPDPSTLYADGTEIAYVGQPRSIPVRQHIMGRGGYRNLKRIQDVRMTGRLMAGKQVYGLKISGARPALLRREISLAGDHSVAETGISAGVTTDSEADRGLPEAAERALLESFEFDGPFVDWPDKGHQVSMAGMRKLGDVLAWRILLQQTGGQTWNMYIDSHTGDLVRKELLDDQERPALGINQSDFREVHEFRFPHRIEYTGVDGQLIAVELIDEIKLAVEPFEMEKPVKH